MSMTTERRTRKPPIQRREEILHAASRIALQEGLQSLTLRRIAEALGIAPGLVNHYFPSVEEMAAAAFAHAAGAERTAILTGLPAGTSPLRQFRAVLSRLLGEESDAVSLLWLDAWQASRTRPALRAEVTRQMELWQDELSRLIVRGVVAGAFSTADPMVAAARILALIDGLSMQAALRPGIYYAAVRDLVTATIERELGLPTGALQAPSG